MDDATYRPRFGRTYDEYKQTDAGGDRLRDWGEGQPYVPRAPQVPVIVPAPCSLSPFCSQRNFHLGPCDDLERIELLTVWDGETGECFYDPSEFVEPQERPFFESENKRDRPLPKSDRRNRGHARGRRAAHH